MRYLLILVAIALAACGDASMLVEPNTYIKCSEYSIHNEITLSYDLVTFAVKNDTTYVMGYQGRDVSLTDSQAARLDTDPTGVCREVM